MKLLQLPPSELRRKLADSGVWLRVGPFSFRVRTDFPEVAEGIAKLYSHFEARCTHESAADFEVSICPPSGLWRWVLPQASLSFDGQPPFGYAPRAEAFALFERGLDQCIADRAHRYLRLRAATVAKGDRAVVLCAPSGAGVSTLVAALALSGWRLLADGLTLVEHNTGLVRGLPRPIRLRGPSLEIVRGLAPDAKLHVTSPKTRNEAQGYLRPPRDSVVCQHDPAHPAWLVFPQLRTDCATTLSSRTEPETLRSLVSQALDGRPIEDIDTKVAARLVAHASGYDLHYRSVLDAVAALDRLAEGRIARLTQESVCV